MTALRSLKRYAALVTPALALASLLVAAAAAAAGGLDPTFDGDGKVVTDVAALDYAEDVAIQPDGKIVVAGRTGAGSGWNFLLLRYDVDGSPDPTFGGGDGVVVTDFGASDAGNSVAVQADGRIVVAGTTSAGGWSANFAVARYNVDGTLDTSFDGDGLVVTDIGGSDGASTVLVLPDGKIVAVGTTRSFSSPSQVAIVRYDVDGSLDNTFDGDGWAVSSGAAGTYDATLDNGGRIVVVGIVEVAAAGGLVNVDVAILRYDAAGAPDASFGSAGVVTLDLGGADYGKAVVTQVGGEVVVAGHRQTSSSVETAFIRLAADGTLDATFDGDGIMLGGGLVPVDLTMQADGKIVVAGILGGDLAVARYAADGSLDPTFDGDGVAVIDFGFVDYATAAAVDAVGRILAAGGSSSSGSSSSTSFSDVAMVRFLPDVVDADSDGVPDASDNCPATANAGQADVDSDGVGDACDPTDDRTAAGQLADLIAQLQSAPLGPGNSFLTKLQAVAASIGAGDTQGACNQLAAFENEVHAQTGKKLTQAEANALLVEVAAIKTKVGCP